MYLKHLVEKNDEYVYFLFQHFFLVNNLQHISWHPDIIGLFKKNIFKKKIFLLQ